MESHSATSAQRTYGQQSDDWEPNAVMSTRHSAPKWLQRLDLPLLADQIYSKQPRKPDNTILSMRCLGIMSHASTVSPNPLPATVLNPGAIDRVHTGRVPSYQTESLRMTERGADIDTDDDRRAGKLNAISYSVLADH
ncbi:unnamed protein product [Cutaneotrichosporon oleaginosum]